MADPRVRSRQGDTVDLIAWRHYGATAGTTEALLDHNPGLADLGPILPIGTWLNLPPAPAATVRRPAVSLWD